jgi:hypothetical protein
MPKNIIHMASPTKKVFISATTGKYVKPSYAKTHPNTTVKMTVKKGR